MPVATKEIQRRTRSITNTKKITKALELVSASKMRKAVAAVTATRPYSEAAWNIIRQIAATTDVSHHPLLQKRANVKKIGLILITSNRGLCGGFNREIIDHVGRYMRNHKKQVVDIEAEVLLMGSRGKDVMFKHGHEIVAEFTKLDVATRISEVTPMAKMAIDAFRDGTYDKIVVAYTDFASSLVQKPRIKKLLPIEHEDNELGYTNQEPADSDQEALESFEYTFEPSPRAVLEQMIYRLVELQIYQALLESNASEHSARMLAMRNASDAANDMIEDLTLSYNQARQQSITSELAEISASRAAIT